MLLVGMRWVGWGGRTLYGMASYGWTMTFILNPVNTFMLKLLLHLEDACFLCEMWVISLTFFNIKLQSKTFQLDKTQGQARK